MAHRLHRGMGMLAFLLAAGCAATAGQAPPDTPGSLPQFDVVSVKTTSASGLKSGMRGGPGSAYPGRIMWPQVSLMSVITRAYGVFSEQVQGPGWLDTQMYSISATFPARTGEAHFRQMLQRLLADRFHLTLHHDAKDLAAYDLTVSRNGYRMKPLTADQAATAGSSVEPVPGPRETDKDGFPVLKPGDKQIMSIGGGTVHGTFRTTMAEFAKELRMMIAIANGENPNASVFDKTGLSGAFSFKLEFAQRLRSDADAAADAARAPNLFSALDKQAGLKLERRKYVMDRLVIDRIERIPTAN